MSKDNIEKTSVTYWLNQLQNLKIDQDIFLTINPFRELSEDKIFKKSNLLIHIMIMQHYLIKAIFIKFKIKKILYFVEVILVTVFMRME